MCNTRSCSLLFVTCALVCLNRSIVHGEVLTASFVPTTSTGFNTGAGQAIDPPAPDPFDNRVAQTFLATVSGTVARVSFTAYQSAGTTAPLRVDIASVVGGLPGTSLGNTIVPIDDFPSSVDPPELNIDADFGATGPLLQAGTSYAILFSSEAPNANYRIHGLHGTGTYADGAYFFSQNDAPWDEGSTGDLRFEVAVTPIPEPSSWTLALLACVLALFLKCARLRNFVAAG